MEIKRSGQQQLLGTSYYSNYYGKTMRAALAADYIIYETDLENRVVPIDLHIFLATNSEFYDSPGFDIKLYHGASTQQEINQTKAFWSGGSDGYGSKLFEYTTKGNLTFTPSFRGAIVDNSDININTPEYIQKYYRINLPYDLVGKLKTTKIHIDLVTDRTLEQIYPSGRSNPDDFWYAIFHPDHDLINDVGYCYKNLTWTLNSSWFDEEIAPEMPEITSASSFYDTGNPFVATSHGWNGDAKSFQLYATIDGKVVIQRRDLDQYSTVHEVILTAEERAAIRAAAYDTTRKECVWHLESVYEDMSYTSTYAVEVIIIALNPILDVTLEDTNTETLWLTQNSNVFIRYFSDVSYKMTATPQTEAEITHVSASNSGQVYTTLEGTFNDVESDRFVFTATDSRGNVTTKTISTETITFKNYRKLTCNLTAQAPTTSGVVSILVSGNFWGDFFRQGYRNDLSVMYRYREKNGSWGDWIYFTQDQVAKRDYNDIMTTSADYEATIEIEGFDYMKTYIFQARAFDSLMTVDSATKTLKTFPVYDWGDDDFKFNVPVYYKDMDTNTKYNLSGVAKALFNSYQLDTTATAGSNYSSVDASAVLLGNNLRCYLYAARSAASGEGNITNETICRVSVKHDGKIKSTYRIAFGNGATGSTASLVTSNEQNDGTYLTFDIILAATANTTTEISTFFILPCTLNLEAY